MNKMYYNFNATKLLKYKVNKQGCWEVTSHKPQSRGYIPIMRNGVFYLIHRLIFKIIYGPIPPGMCVCHSCDNRKCINPEHLFLGTDQDNTNDMMKKGRHNRGIGNVKLTI